jgi:hypothetical protein
MLYQFAGEETLGYVDLKNRYITGDPGGYDPS